MTNGNKLSWPFGVCVCARADCLEAKLTPYNDLPVVFSGYPPALGRCLNFKSLSSNVFYEELVPNSLIASPLMKPYFTPGGGARGEVRKLEGLGRLVLGFDAPDGILDKPPITFLQKGKIHSRRNKSHVGSPCRSVFTIILIFNKNSGMNCN